MVLNPIVGNQGWLLGIMYTNLRVFMQRHVHANKHNALPVLC